MTACHPFTSEQGSLSKSRNKNITVIIDAGHGGTDRGTRSRDKSVFEKNLALSTALMLQDHLRHFGYRPILTRSKDIFIPLYKRAAFANQKKGNIFVSIHFNSAPNHQAEGVEIFYYKPEKQKTKQITPKSKYLAEHVLSKICYYTHAKARGVKRGNFAVIRKTWMPAILVEGGFLSNTNETKKLKQSRYLNHLAYGIAVGINDYFHKAS